MHYAHRTDSDDPREWQLLTDHLAEVARRAGEFADAFGAKEWGETAGWLHDIGKFSEAFQKRLRGSPIPVDHATAGAQYLVDAWGNRKSSRLLAYVIAGHHAGLQDYGNDAGDESCLARRLQKSIEPYRADAERALPKLKLTPLPPPIRPGLHPGLQFSLLTRMLFSCLVDADSLDTEYYVEPAKSLARGNPVSFSDLLNRYDAYMADRFGEADTPIKRIRGELLRECLEAADEERGLFTLTMPTGSGKTLASLGFALKHAVRHQMRRIIFVVPYTSIIEQNAAVFREVLGAEHVLEHHSNVQHESTEYSDDIASLSDKLRLAEENWDYPVIVTTNVQFFESLFANKRSRCRKLHNIARSVIVLDEAQMMNGELYRPSLYALEELTRNYGVTVVLSTATQPDVGAIFPQPVPIREMVRDTRLRYEQFRRVRLMSIGKTDYDALAERIGREKQALCIVNTRRAARELYEKVAANIGEDAVRHLSARMCPKHRLRKLTVIRKRLEEGLPCVLISTQLIECGVDVDFPVVYRELAGLDSIAQAAGRCNRHGTRPLSTTYVFETDATPARGWFGLTAGVTRSVLDKHTEDPLSLDAVKDYFEGLRFYQTLGIDGHQQDMMDKQGILPLLSEKPVQNCEFPFRTIAERFQLIDTAAKPVIVPYDETAEEQLEALQYAIKINGIMRKLQPYVVQLYPQEFHAFLRAGEIVEVRDGVYKLKNPERWYDETIGIRPYSEQYHAEEVYVL